MATIILTAGLARTNVIQSSSDILTRSKPHAKPSHRHRCRCPRHRNRTHVGLPGAVGAEVPPAIILLARRRNAAVLGNRRQDTGISLPYPVRTATEGIRPAGRSKLPDHA